MLINIPFQWEKINIIYDKIYQSDQPEHIINKFFFNQSAEEETFWSEGFI